MRIVRYKQPAGGTRPRIRRKEKMKSTAVDTTQLRDPGCRAAGTDGFLITPARAFSKLGDAVLAGHKLLGSAAIGLLLGLTGVAEAQQYAFSTIDMPSATRTAATGNSSTAIAGGFDDANGNTHGFILSH